MFLQIGNRAENQAMIMAIKIIFNHPIGNSIPGFMHQHQPTENSLLGLDGSVLTNLKSRVLGLSSLIRSSLTSNGSTAFSTKITILSHSTQISVVCVQLGVALPMIVSGLI